MKCDIVTEVFRESEKTPLLEDKQSCAQGNGIREHIFQAEKTNVNRTKLLLNNVFISSLISALLRVV
jgi:hypothetical protein